MSESEMIDLMLEYYVLRPDRLNFEVNDSNRRMYNSALQKVKAYGLIEPTGVQSFNKATEKGYEAYNGGGVDKWIVDNKQRQNEAHQAMVDSAKGTVDAAKSAKKSIVAAWVSGGVSILSLPMAK